MTVSTSPVTWLVVATWAVTIGNAIIPVVPPVWAAILGSIVTLLTVFTHNKQIIAGKVGRIR